MKKLYLLVMVALVAISLQAAVADTTLVQFGVSHYQDWTYHRQGAELSRSFIQQGRVNLFTTDGGEICTLESPVLNCQGMDSLKVYVDYRPHTPYIAAKITLQIDLLNFGGEVVSSSSVKIASGLQQKEVEVMLPVPAHADYTLLFSAPKADTDNCAAVWAVKAWGVTASEVAIGDVNADGAVDVSDVNILINIILGVDSASNYGEPAFISDDDVIDVADINALINLILQK